MIHRKALRRGVRGFSLIELMVALVVGLIVTGAVLAFTMSSLRSNTEFVQSTRLTQELRNSIGFVSSELRRAGYDEHAMNYYTQRGNGPTQVSPFSLLHVDDAAPAGAGGTDSDCVIYAYDRGAPAAPGVVKLSDGEIRGIRLRSRNVNGVTVGVLETAESATGVSIDCDGASPDYTKYPAACNAGSGWCALSDPRVLNVGNFDIDDSQSSSVQVGPGLPFRIRDLQITLTGSLVGSGAIQRSVFTRIRVRADCMRPPGEDPGVACNSVPTGT
jgi:prepilin-type N-terminal cleavage/methylation domain-containing protein